MNQFKHIPKTAKNLFYALTLIFCGLPPLHAAEPNWSEYGELLKRHVTAGQRHGVKLAIVDYPGIKSDPLYARTLRLLADFSPTRLSTAQEKKAFYINAYNILAIQLVIDHWPTKSIKDIGGFFSPVWTLDVGPVGGQPITLDHIEHKILRKMGDPRIHFAIVCASISCPDLRTEPYVAAQLDSQLDDQAKQFLKNPDKGALLMGDVIRVSLLFSWFYEDFGGRDGVERTLRKYRPDLPLKIKVEAKLPYDWALNGPASEAPQTQPTFPQLF